MRGKINANDFKRIAQPPQVRVGGSGSGGVGAQDKDFVINSQRGAGVPTAPFVLGKYVSDSDDLILCKLWQPAHGVNDGMTISAWKPYHLQKTEWVGQEFIFDNGDVYTYTSDAGSSIRREASLFISGGGGSSVEVMQEVAPDYHSGEVIVLALIPVGVAPAGGGNTIAYWDINVAARGWATTVNP